MPDQDRRPVPVESAEDEALLASIAVEFGVEVEQGDTRAVDPVSMLLLVGAAAAVAGAVDHYLERRQGGQVIDLRPDAETTAYRDKGLMFGLVLIRAADGSVTIEVKEPRNYWLEIVNKVIDAVQGLATKSLDALTAAAKSAVGDQATVTAEPS